MYESYNSHSGQGPQAPMHPPYPQRPLAPPPIPHNFQQRPVVPQAHIPPSSGQPGMSTYQQGPPVPTPMVGQRLPGAMPSTGHSYMRPPPTVYGSAPLPHMYLTTQQNSQQPPYLVPGPPLPPPPPPPPLGSHRPEMLRAPLPPGGLHPPPSQGQTLYRAPVYQPPLQSGGVRGLQHIPLPRPLLASSSVLTSSPSVSSVESMAGNSQLPSMVLLPLPPPPPPPSSPPPIPRSPLAGLNSAYHSNSNPTSERSMALDSPPPPKPTEEKIAQKIEDLCQLIAKNGSSYEDMTRKKEYGNPEFKFLFGGEPGSEAALAYEYFLWRKKQFVLACKIDEGKTHSPLRHSGTECSIEQNHMSVDAGSHSPADSDMEMEDDITPIEVPTQAHDLTSSEFDVKEHVNALQSSAVSDAVMVGKVQQSLGLSEQGSKLISNHDRLTFGSSAGAAECPSASNNENSTTLADDKSSLRASAAAKGIDSDKHSGKVIEGGSPFRLLQDYASDDSSENEEPCLKDASSQIFLPSNAVGSGNLHKDMESQNFFKTEEYGLLSESSMLFRAQEFSLDSQREVKETGPTSSVAEWTTENIDAKHENQTCIGYAASPKAFLKEDASGGASLDVAFGGKYEKDNENNRATISLNAPKIDKFGRLVREGASDSDSDDSRDAGRYNKRRRSHSQSRSPLNRRRRRRSPRRRREKRSRSRSWSPRNRRSRSRSPSHRHAGEFSSGYMRRDKGKMPDCFDFIRGRCYRGASCRYLHHDSQKNDGSRRHRSKQQYPRHPSKNSNAHEEIKRVSQRLPDHEHEIMSQQSQHSHEMLASSFDATKGGKSVEKREDSLCDALQYIDSNVDGQLIESIITKPGRSREVSAKVPDKVVAYEELENRTSHVDENFQKAKKFDWPLVTDSFSSEPIYASDVLKSHDEARQNVPKDSAIQQSESDLSNPVLEDADHPLQQTDDSSVSNSSSDKTSAASQKKLPESETLPNVADSADKPSRLQSAPLPEGINAPHMMQALRDHNFMPQNPAFQSQPAPLESVSPYMLPNQNPLYTVPPNSSQASLPPLPSLFSPYAPTVNVRTTPPGVPLQFQPSHLPPRNNFGFQMFSRPSTELPGHSQAGEINHRAYPPVPEPHQQTDDFKLKPLPGSNTSGQHFGGPDLFKEDRALGSIAQGNNYSQPIFFSQESTAIKPAGENLNSSSHMHPYSHQEQPHYGLCLSLRDSVYGLPGQTSSSRYPPDVPDTNQTSLLPDFGVSRSSTHYNPYASTFEQPLSSRFSSDVFRKEKDSTYTSLTHDGQVAGIFGSRQAASSTNSARGVGQIIPKLGGDRYDPLFDSMEPSSNSYKKFDHIQKWEPTNDSNGVLRRSGSNQPLDVEENNRKKEVGGIALPTSFDNEEFGETADAEVGDIENESQSNANGMGNMNMGEMEIDQIKSPGKSKKNKESRSMKLFKVCLAEFVKEVLKPSWRQGNMSKETFKTVVKKTVDKVSGSMKSHQIPKSRVKINQYIDSSQPKLTKLVMGYVDKYAKG